MAFLKKSKRMAHIVIDDYVIRIATSKGPRIDSIKLLEEREVPPGLLEHGKIMDEMAFYEWMKKLIRELGIRRYSVQFYVPNSLVIMRHVTFPKELVGDAIQEYFYTEIEKSIHLPFQEALFDIYVPENMGKNEKEMTHSNRDGVLFAAPEEEVAKYISILEDVSLQPEAVDIEPLGVYRYFYDTHQVDRKKVLLFFEMNLTSYHLSIFHHHVPEFIRHQYLDVSPSSWQVLDNDAPLLHWEYQQDKEYLWGEIADQLTELGRIMDFYRYSLYKGEKEVDEIIVHGDYPHLEAIVTQLKEQYDIPITLLRVHGHEIYDEAADIRFAPVLGLVLKGESPDASRY